ncbi:flagellar assembly factor FliW [Tepiditoga spiralis]|uniref:Flagellar assembly factor FliW n=1 Tax=Tepiditoga spiralis TaxID=2108365 RepID=A0A7G1GAF2_9BACT|nr:flagellar assembly protein FliW [Tepiditoga spiralis]BBE30449.1 flagellar assembly factor FliW [Tepiditoga spiralis]
MNVTTKLGISNISEKEIITFEYGMPGFETLKKFVLLTPEESKPIMWLASIENKEIAFPVIHPELIRSDYSITLPKDIVDYLELKTSKDALTLSILTINDTNTTINLLAPIIISLKNKLGIQLIIENTNYTTKHDLKEELKRTKVLKGAD